MMKKIILPPLAELARGASAEVHVLSGLDRLDPLIATQRGRRTDDL